MFASYYFFSFSLNLRPIAVLALVFPPPAIIRLGSFFRGWIFIDVYIHCTINCWKKLTLECTGVSKRLSR